MNWFVVVEHDLSEYSAARTHATEFCLALSKYEDVTLITYSKGSPISGGSNISSISYKPVSMRPNNLGYIFSTIKIFVALLNLKRYNKVDIVYIRSSAFGFGPLLFAKLSKIPGVVEVNGIWRDEQMLSIKSTPVYKRWLIAPVQYLRHLSLVCITRYADHIIAVTPKIAAYLTSMGINKEKITIARNGVNTDTFTPRDKDESKKSLGLNKDIIYIGFVGSLTAWQGTDDLLVSLSLIETSASINLLIIGDGSERDNLKALAKKLNIMDRVHFLGKRPYMDIPTYISACDLLAAPKKSLLSGYSTLKVYEYMACARPIIASRVNGLEFISEYNIGYLFSPGDPNDIKEKILNFLDSDMETRRQMGKRARQLAVDNFSWDATAQQIRSSIRGSSLS